jgi:lipoprotein NlpD
MGRTLLVLGLCALVLSACTSEPPLPSPEVSEEEAQGLVYVVKPGDTLAVIALQHGKNYRNLARWNSINPPYTIYPGQHLRLTPPPAPEGRESTLAAAPGGETPAAETPPVEAQEEAGEEAKPEEKLYWQWPAQGKTIHGFSSLKGGSQGLDITGWYGEPVYAAADGKVVYSGSGLIGYGQLIIVKHNRTYLSAYAHNKVLLAKEGDQVVRGQQIAEMGRNQRRQVVLHFQIRRNGKPVNPLQYLPRQQL